MQKRIHCSLIALYGVLLIFVVGCGAAPQLQSANSNDRSSPVNAPLTAVDWANFTYFSSCYENTHPFHTKNGTAVNDYVHFRVFLPPKYGDLTGDEQPEAVVPYQCSAADARGVHVFVYTGNASHVRLIGDLPPPNAEGAFDNVTGITISHQELHLEGDGYSSHAAHCCPDLFIKTSYRWNGKEFVPGPSNISKR
ncbi:MAG: hypothetical protein ACJ8BW_24430 [Ktedonobacteraceae bacterium]|jgi:hypothetical protein